MSNTPPLSTTQNNTINLDDPSIPNNPPTPTTTTTNKEAPQPASHDKSTNESASNNTDSTATTGPRLSNNDNVVNKITDADDITSSASTSHKQTFVPIPIISSNIVVNDITLAPASDSSRKPSILSNHINTSHRTSPSPILSNHIANTPQRTSSTPSPTLKPSTPPSSPPQSNRNSSVRITPSFVRRGSKPKIAPPVIVKTNTMHDVHMNIALKHYGITPAGRARVLFNRFEAMDVIDASFTENTDSNGNRNRNGNGSGKGDARSNNISANSTGEHSHAQINKNASKCNVVELSSFHMVKQEDKLEKWRRSSSRFRAYWETSHFIAYCVNSFFVPVRVIFGIRSDGNNEGVIVTVVCAVFQVVFMVDFYLRARKFYIEDGGVVITDVRAIFRKYQATWLYYDVLSSLPVYNILLILGVRKTTAVFFLALQLVKLVRYFEYWKFIGLYITKKSMTVNAAIMQVSKIIILLVILMSIMACVLIRMGCNDYDEINGECVDANSWMLNTNLSENGITKSSPMTQLNSAIYVVSQALFTVGYGDVTTSSSITQRVFTIIMMLIGTFSYASVIAVMSSVIANQDMLYVEFRYNLERMNNYVKSRGFDEGMQKRLSNHVAYLFEKQYGKLEISILNELPYALRSQVLMQNKTLVMSHPFLSNIKDEVFISEIIKILIPRTYSPATVVVSRHSRTPSMYLIRFGKLDVIGPDHTSVVTSLLSGEHFGGFEFMFMSLHEFTYKTATFSELLILDRSGLDELLTNPRFVDIKDYIKESVGDISRYLNRGLLGKGDAKFVPKKKKVDGGDAKNGIISPVESGAASPQTDSRVVDGAAHQHHQQDASAGDRSDASNVFSSDYIENLKLEIEAGDKDDKDDDANATTATKEVERKRYRRGVVMLLLDWWETHNAINEKISIFTKNITGKKKFAEMMMTSGDDSAAKLKVPMPDYFVLLSGSRLRILWDVLSMVITAWLIVVIPIRLYQGVLQHGSLINHVRGDYLIVDYFCDAFFVINMYLHARVFALTEINEQGKIIDITERSAMLMHYWRTGRLVNDLIIFFPYDILSTFIGSSYNVLRIPKLLLAFRFPLYIHRIKVHLDRFKIRLSAYVILSLNLLVFSVIFTHWASSIWIMMQEHTVRDGNSIYIAAVYWCLVTITTVGFGDITPNSISGRWFCTGLIVVGSCFTASIVANITSMAHNVTVSEDNSQHITTCVEKYMAEKKLPHDLRERCLRYFRILHDTTNEDKHFDKFLPPPFVPEIRNEMYGAYVIGTDVFKEANVSKGLVRSICDMINEEIIVERDWVVHDNPAHDRWYFVKTGTVKLVGVTKGQLIRTVTAGEMHASFGEQVLFNPNYKEYNAKAVTNCILLSISPEKFIAVERNYKAEFEAMRAFLKTEAARNLNSNHGSRNGNFGNFERGGLTVDNDDQGVDHHIDDQGDQGKEKEKEKTEVKLMGPSNILNIKSRIYGIKVHPSSSSLGEEISSSQIAGNGNGDPNANAKKTHLEQLQHWIKSSALISPKSDFCLRWNRLVLFFLLYNSIAIPFRIAFMGGLEDAFTLFLIVDYVGDLVFIADMRLRKNRFGYMEGDTVVMDANKVRDNYYKNSTISISTSLGRFRFKISRDVLAVLPIEVLCIIINIHPLKTGQIFGILRVFRLLRSSYLREHIRCFDVGFTSLFGDNGKSSLTVLKLISLILVCAHYFACVWFFIAFFQHSNDYPNWGDCNNSIKPNRMFGCEFTEVNADTNVTTVITEPVATLFTQYIRSLYWATTALTTAGFGDISAVTRMEQLFSIIAIVVGTVIFAIIISNLEEIVAQVDVTSTLFQEKLDEVNAFMKMRDITVDTRDEIGIYYETLWLNQRGASENAILQYLPERIRNEVLKIHTLKILKAAPIFDRFASSFINSLLSTLKSDFFDVGQHVYRKGECAFELFFVVVGRVDLMDGKKKLIAVSSDSLLGEGEFFKRQARACAAVASEFTNLFILENEALQSLLDIDPIHRAIFEERVIAEDDRIDIGRKIANMKGNMKSGGKMALMLNLEDDNTVATKLHVFLPNSHFKRFWDQACVVVIMINVFSVPFRIAFYPDMNADGFGQGEGKVLENLALDLFFWVDIVLRFRMFATFYQGMVISDRDKFSRVYLKGQFKWDLLACFPFDTIAFVFGLRDISALHILRLPRLIRIHWLPSLFTSAVDFFEEQGFRAKAGIWNIVRIFIFVVIMIHINACALYYIAVLAGLDGPKTWTAGTSLESATLPIFDRYSLCLYWSVYTMTLVGYGDITLKSNGEMIFSIVCMLMGALLSDAGITAVLSSLVHAMDASNGNAQAWALVIAKYMKYRALPLDLREQIFGYFIHMHLSEDDLDETKILNKQPRFVKFRLLEEICFDAMKDNFEPLRPFDDGFVQSIVRGMYPYLALPKEILISSDTPCDKVYLIIQGKVQVLKATSNSKYLITNVLERDSIVGNFASATNVVYRTVTYCELYCLNMEHYSLCFQYANNHEVHALRVVDRIAARGNKPSHRTHLNLNFLSSGRNSTYTESKGIGRRRRDSKLSATEMVTTMKLKRKWTVWPSVMPDSAFRKGWNAASFLLAAYLAVMAPVEALFLPTYYFFNPGAPTWLLLLNLFDAFVDLFFLADLVLRLKVFNDFSVNVVDKKQSITWAYVETHTFWVDALSSIPYEHIASITIKDNIGIYRLFKLGRCLRISDYVAGIFLFLEDKRALTHIGLQRMWKLFAMCTIGGHWAACLFYYISRRDANSRLNLNDHQLLPETWIEADGLIFLNCTIIISLDDLGNAISTVVGYEMVYLKTLPEMYIRSLYWAYVIMITTGFGDIVPHTSRETIIGIFVMFAGVLLTCSSLANLTLLVSNFDQASNDFHQKLDNVKKYLTYQQVPADLGNKIRQYYEYQWTILRGVDESIFLSELTPQLQQQFLQEMRKEFLLRVNVLHRAPGSLVISMLGVDVMDKVLLSPGDTLVEVGQPHRGLYLLIQGTGEVLSSNRGKKGKIESILRQGDHVGSPSLFVECEVTESVRAKSYCEFLFMDVMKFTNMANNHCSESVIKQMAAAATMTLNSAEKLKKLTGGSQSEVGKDWRSRFLPGRKGRKRWDLVAMFGLIFYAIEIPLTLAHSFDPLSATFMVFRLVFDSFFILDLIMRAFFFPYRDSKTGVLVMDKKDIYQHYVESKSILRRGIGIFICVPFEFLLVTSVLSTRFLGLLRVAKVKRLLDLTKLIGELEEGYIDELKRYNTVIKRFIKLNFFMIFVCHVTGCVWYFTGMYAKEVLNQPNWIDYDNTQHLNHLDLWGSAGYMRAFYFALVSTSTVGYGDIVPHSIVETAVAAIIILIGGVVLPAVVGGLASLMGNMNANIAHFKRQMETLDEYMYEHDFPRPLQERVKNYYNYLWTRLGGVSNREDVLFDLPLLLRDELSKCIKGPILAGISFLKDADPEVMKSIRARLRSQIFLPGDMIIRQGDFGEQMYLIEKGLVYIVNEDHSIVFAKLERGDYFGESSLLNNEKRVATCISPGYCDCLVLTKLAWEEITDLHPDEGKAITAKIMLELRRKTRTSTAVELNLNKNNKITMSLAPKKNVKEEIKIVTEQSYAHPDSFKRQCWDLILLTILLINVFVTPFQIVFSNSMYYGKLGLYIFEYCLDVFFLIDICLQNTVFQFVEGGKIVTERDEISKYYHQTHFNKDVLSSLPWDIIALVIWMSGADAGFVAKSMAIARIPKSFRIIRLKHYSSAVEKLIASFSIKRGGDAVKLFQLLVVVLFISHVAGCFFFLVAERGSSTEGHNGRDCAGLDNDELIDWGTAFTECKWEHTWMQSQKEGDKIDFRGGTTYSQYVRSLYWALPTLVVVVIGDVIPLTSYETLYCLLWMLVGVTINASIVGSIASIVANLETESSLFIKRVDTLQDYLHQHGLPQGIQDRSRKYLDWLWTHKRGRNQDTILSDLPYTLRQEVSNLRRVKYVLACPFFVNLTMPLVEALALSFKSHIYSVQDQIVAAGDESFELFFIERGGVQVVLGDGKTVCASLREGTFFGESALFESGNRMASIRAADFCELLTLHREDFNSVFKHHPEELVVVKKVFMRIQATHLSKNKKSAQENRRRKDSVMLHLNSIRGAGGLIVSKTTGPMVVIFRICEANLMQHHGTRVMWEGLGLLFCIYFNCIIPMRISFFHDDMWNMYEIDYLVDVYFVVDIIFRASFFNDDVAEHVNSAEAEVAKEGKSKFAGKLPAALSTFETNLNGNVLFTCEMLSRRKYRSGWMIVDIVSSLPIDFVRLIPGCESYAPFLRLIHFIRIYRLFDYIKSIEDYLYHIRIRISADVIQLAKVMLVYVLTVHIYSCGWMIIHRHLERDYEHTWATNDGISTYDALTGEHDICTDWNIFRCYLRSFYFVLTTISSVGLGDIYPASDKETLFELVVVISGACLGAVLIGSFAALFQGIDKSGNSAFKMKLNVIQEYLHYKDIPGELSKKILKHHKSIYKHRKTLDESTVMTDLPQPLQMEVSMYINRSVIYKVPLLRDCSLTVQKFISLCLKRQMAETYSFVYEAGDIGQDIYFIVSGSVVLHKGQDVSKLDKAARGKPRRESTQFMLKDGDSFGEDVVVSKTGVRNESARAMMNCDLYSLSKGEIDGLLVMLGPEGKIVFLERLLKREIDSVDELVEGSMSDNREKKVSFIKPRRRSSILEESMRADQAHALRAKVSLKKIEVRRNSLLNVPLIPAGKLSRMKMKPRAMVSQRSEMSIKMEKGKDEEDNEKVTVNPATLEEKGESSSDDDDDEDEEVEEYKEEE